ncbi:pyruvate dehydrogenase E2 component [Methanocella paludicola SANAE]|uniref:Pyruvate dehydrogenase E2 component n=1 Tax=Methanocella paludicola (strain DSM 17711 / JCM 13418 / NBRC 101707 / SANAE) TaxID=304371 RepID=D1YZB9_METPS|nr:dihydrolipoamide acetyltransferase family protein [Methanocella paludicola]BAI61791.1 pyruvate dehydrogenase E2 component [Methanocella paludicola SANAE]
MAYEFKLPDLGEGITSGEIKKWHVRKGQKVEEDQTIAEVETDKAVVELPSPVTGIVEDIKAPEGGKVNVGEVIAVIKEEGAPEAPPQPKAAEKAQEARKPEVPAPKAEAQKVPVLATPATRMLAKQLGVNIDSVKGTGPMGRITDEDVRSAAQKPAAKPAEAPVPAPAMKAAGKEERIPFRGIRRTISENMIRSVSKTAQVTLVDDADLTRLVEFRERINKKLGGEVKISYLALFVKAVVAALIAHPTLNSSLDEEKGEIVLKKYYNIGIAVDTDRGLIVPVLKDADKKSLIDISKELVHIIELTRDGRIGIEQLKGNTFTIANIGSVGGLFSTPIINYPDVAILEMQQIRDMPRVVDGSIVIRKVMYLPLTIDHRIVDGAEGQRFMNDLKRFLEDPEQLLVSMV